MHREVENQPAAKRAVAVGRAVAVDAPGNPPGQVTAEAAAVAVARVARVGQVAVRRAQVAVAVAEVAVEVVAPVPYAKPAAGVLAATRLKADKQYVNF